MEWRVMTPLNNSVIGSIYKFFIRDNRNVKELFGEPPTTLSYGYGNIFGAYTIGVDFDYQTTRIKMLLIKFVSEDVIDWNYMM